MKAREMLEKVKKDHNFEKNRVKIFNTKGERLTDLYMISMRDFENCLISMGELVVEEYKKKRRVVLV